MFAKLTGKIDSTGLKTAILDVNGVGYLVHCSSRTLSQLTAQSEASFYIETQIREDAITLYGFLTQNDQDWFKLLTSVQGVGGKAALSILSVLTPQDLTNAIAAHDKKMVSQADGVGPKLADRICNELKNKVGSLSADTSAAGVSAPAANTNESSIANDAISALVNLGFGRAEAYKAVNDTLTQNQDANIQDLIQAGLKQLSA